MSTETEVKDATRQYKTAIERILNENDIEISNEIKVLIRVVTLNSRNLINLVNKLQKTKEKEVTGNYII